MKTKLDHSFSLNQSKSTGSTIDTCDKKETSDRSMMVMWSHQMWHRLPKLRKDDIQVFSQILRWSLYSNWLHERNKNMWQSIIGTPVLNTGHHSFQLLCKSIFLNEFVIGICFIRFYTLTFAGWMSDCLNVVIIYNFFIFNQIMFHQFK